MPSVGYITRGVAQPAVHLLPHGGFARQAAAKLSTGAPAGVTADTSLLVVELC
jgi:hypothetical protein